MRCFALQQMAPHTCRTELLAHGELFAEPAKHRSVESLYRRGGAECFLVGGSTQHLGPLAREGWWCELRDAEQVVDALLPPHLRSPKQKG